MNRMQAAFSRLFLILTFLWPLTACPTTDAHASRRDGPDAPLEVDRDLYDRTFNEILLFIKNMDEIIAAKDFEKWKTKCSPEYLARYSNPAVLRDLSEKPNLKDSRIVLRSLEDYFYRVFVPSRVRAPLDRISFIEKNRVKAVTVVNGVPYVVYYLEKDSNNEWKIGVW